MVAILHYFHVIFFLAIRALSQKFNGWSPNVNLVQCNLRQAKNIFNLHILNTIQDGDYFALETSLNEKIKFI